MQRYAWGGIKISIELKSKVMMQPNLKTKLQFQQTSRAHLPCLSLPEEAKQEEFLGQFVNPDKDN